MREILFRGKRVDNGEWVCSGNLIHFNEDNECYIPVANSGCTCTHDENDNIIEWNEVLFCKVITETVGQCTGVIDKNGKKIFEGDIVEGADFTVEDGGYGVVYFDECAFEVNGNNIIGTFHENYWGKEFEVIGNIHDNPELLEYEV